MSDQVLGLLERDVAARARLAEAASKETSVQPFHADFPGCLYVLMD